MLQETKRERYDKRFIVNVWIVKLIVRNKEWASLLTYREMGRVLMICDSN